MYINTRLARTGLILLSTTAVINAFSVSQTQSPVGQASALPLTRLQSHPSSIIANLSSSSSTLLSPTEYENQHYTNAVATGERIRRAAMFSLTIGGVQCQIMDFQTLCIAIYSSQICSYIPPLEIAKVWWCYFMGLCGYQPPHRGTFGLHGIEMAG